MIILVAIKKEGIVYSGRLKDRHDSLYFLYPNLLQKPETNIQGFLTEGGVFLNREQAARHAYECGQVKELNDSLISEQLW
jgi:hypothetical protein